MAKIGRHLSKVDKAVHRGEEGETEDWCCSSSEFESSGLATVKNFLVQVACSIFCLCILYSISLIFAESAGLIIEVSLILIFSFDIDLSHMCILVMIRYTFRVEEITLKFGWGISALTARETCIQLKCW